MASPNKGRLAYADLLRCAAMAAVIVLHLAGSQLENVAVGSFAFHVLNVYDSLSHWCVPVFVMLSGMFLLDPDHPLPLSKLLRGHIFRIFVALVVWGAAYALAAQILTHGLHVADLWNALYQVALGQTHFHLWFLYMIIGLYLVTPILRAFVRGASRAEFHWFFALVFIFAWLLPNVLRLRPSQTVSLWINNLNLHLVMGYVGYYVLGYYLRTYPLSRKARNTLYGLGILGAAGTIAGTAWLSQQRGMLAQTFYNYDNPTIALMSIAVFLFFQSWAANRPPLPRRHPISVAAKVSFGVYLSHAFFLMLLNHLGITVLSFSPVLAVPVLAAVVLACSLAVAWVLSKLPVAGRYLT